MLQILQETYVTQGNKVILFSKGREIMEENTVNTVKPPKKRPGLTRKRLSTRKSQAFSRA